MRARRIGRRSDAEVQAEADRKWHGDTEKVPTSPTGDFMVCGVRIVSRYRKAHEYEVMQNAFLTMRVCAACRANVVRVFCDSKACAVYTIALEEWDEHQAQCIGREFEAQIMQYSEGHNGIWIEAPGGGLFKMEPNWSMQEWITDDG
jgi:hypothetical protein